MNKQYVLKKSYDIEKLLKVRQSVGSKYYVLYFDKTNDSKTNIAISASKKLGNAVTRNYQKRVTREIVREILPQIAGYRMLLVIKFNATLLDYEQKKEQINYVINKMKKQGEKDK